MAPPATSRWDTGAEHDAWFLRRRPTVISQCVTDGFNFVVELRGALNRAASPAIGLRDWDNRPLAPVPNDGPAVWDGALLRALHAVARRGDAPQPYLDVIMANASSGQISRQTLHTAVAMLNGVDLGDVEAGNARGLAVAIENIRIPEDAVMPPFGVAITDGPVGREGAQCAASELLPTDPNANFAPPAQAPFNPLLVFGVIAAAAIGVAVLTADVPQTDSFRRTRRTGRSR